MDSTAARRAQMGKLAFTASGYNNKKPGRGRLELWRMLAIVFGASLNEKAHEVYAAIMPPKYGAIPTTAGQRLSLPCSVWRRRP